MKTMDMKKRKDPKWRRDIKREIRNARRRLQPSRTSISRRMSGLEYEAILIQKSLQILHLREQIVLLEDKLAEFLQSNPQKNKKGKT